MGYKKHSFRGVFFGLKEIFAKKILFSVHLEGRVEQRMFNSIANLLEQALTEKQPINPVDMRDVLRRILRESEPSINVLECSQ